MATKNIDVPDIGTVTFQKRRRTNSVKIHIQGTRIKVTQPIWVPYKAALAFVNTRKEWIKKHHKAPQILGNGSLVGKKHQITIEPTGSSRSHTKIYNGTINIKLPRTMDIESTEVQNKLKKAAEKALFIECETLITPLISDIALANNLPYKSISYKRLKSRWGSCDQHNNIVLNIYLIQHTWPEIEYVIIHELSHTKHHNHSKQFWSLVADCMPRYKTIRKQLKEKQPDIMVS